MRIYKVQGHRITLRRDIVQSATSISPYVLNIVVIVGDEESQNRTVAIRDRRKKEQYNLNLAEFMVLLRHYCFYECGNFTLLIFLFSII